MQTRRHFLATVSTFILTVLAPPMTLSAKSPHESALDAIEERILDSLARVGDEVNFPRYLCHWWATYEAWREVPDVRGKIRRTLQETYANPVMRQIKADYGSVIEPSGRLRLSAMYALADSFPILPDRWDKDLFKAFGTFAPEHLV